MAGLNTLNNWVNKLKENYAGMITGSVIDTHINETNDFFFVQIGAFDGVRNNPIRKYILRYKWNGILIEPVKHLFDRLVSNYKGHSNLIFENVAISDKNETKDFYFLKENNDNLVFWYEEIGSLSGDIILKHKDAIPNIEDYLVTTKVNCVALTALLKKHNIKKIDLLQIDSEGYDYKIIKSIDFKVINPKIILYERIHLNNYDSKECVAFLKDNGYNVIELGVDAIAFIMPKKSNMRLHLIKLAYIFNNIILNKLRFLN